MGKIDLFLRHTWLYLYSTRTMGATVLSQDEKNLGEGSERSIIVIMTLDDSSEDPECLMGLCDRSHYATSPNVPCGWGFELGVTTFGKWDSNSATVAETHFCNRMAEKLRHFWTYSCHITWNMSNRYIVRCQKILNNIIKAKGVCRMTFGKKIRISWVCQYIIRVLKAILWS